MKKFDLKAQSIDYNKFKKRVALESDCSILIDQDCLITDGGEPKILYAKVNCDTSAIRWAVNTIKYSSDTRVGGLKTTSSIFGYSPKVPLRKDFCSATAMAVNFPKQHYILCEFAKELTKIYEKYFPDTLRLHYDTISKKVMEQWVIEGTPFTSGIINKNNPLKYHLDSGNFKNVLSNMLVLKKGVEGGRLSCPEYDIKFECADNRVVIFDGAKILHGVTPIKSLRENSYRYSVVYYSLEQMWKCDTVENEVSRIRIVKKEREAKRV